MTDMKKGQILDFDQDRAAHIERMNRRHEAFMREMAVLRYESIAKHARLMYWLFWISICGLTGAVIAGVIMGLIERGGP